MRIAICGASGTGKSTLMVRIAEKLNLPICPVGSRTVAKEMGFASPYDVDAAGMRTVFQQRLFEMKRDWEASQKYFVTDRTHFDNLSYSLMHGPQSLTTNQFDERIEANDRYTHTFYCPRDRFQKLGSDPDRVDNEAYHVTYDLILRGLLERYALQFDPLVPITVEERLARVLRVVKRAEGPSLVGLL